MSSGATRALWALKKARGDILDDEEGDDHEMARALELVETARVVLEGVFEKRRRRTRSAIATRIRK